MPKSFPFARRAARRLVVPWNIDRAVNRCTGWCITLGLMLTACGGGQGSNGDVETTARSAIPSQETVTLEEEGARLNREELAQIARTGVLPQAFEGRLISGATTKVAATRIPVYRFFNTLTSGHFYTSSETEKATVLATMPHMRLDGVAFQATMTAVPGLSPVHRFFNTRTGVHFYTITESERALVAATMPHYTYDGIAYYASTLPGTGYTPLYRFFYAARGYHFYTNSAAEKDSIIATLPQYTYEGIGYYVLGDDWRAPAVPATGVTSSQCYQAASNVFVACSSSGALSLNAQQDGHRAAINPMSHSQVPSLFGPYPITSCMRDNVTGLVWEGKTASGSRAGSNVYTNNGTHLATDAGGYVDLVNASNLCGYADWRLPTVEELQGLVHQGITTTPRITTASFPNTFDGDHWTSQTYVPPFGGSSDASWAVSFNSGNTGALVRTELRAVRLVRGPVWTGPRYLVTSAAYAGDSANNAVIDRKTGVTWRRCLEGMLWNGTSCTGTTLAFSHQAALSRASARAGWRLPSAKELVSVVDPTQQYLPKMNPDFFTVVPGETSNYISWSASPAFVSDQAWFTWFYFGSTGIASRANLHAVRLVLVGS